LRDKFGRLGVRDASRACLNALTRPSAKAAANADGCAGGEPIGPCYMPDAHIAPAVARSITPVMNIAVSNRVISQLLRIAAPQLLDRLGAGSVQIVNRSRRPLLGEFMAKLAMVRCGLLFPKSELSGKIFVDAEPQPQCPPFRGETSPEVWRPRRPHAGAVLALIDPPIGQKQSPPFATGSSVWERPIKNLVRS
jgi:hypothetical protein